MNIPWPATLVGSFSRWGAFPYRSNARILLCEVHPGRLRAAEVLLRAGRATVQSTCVVEQDGAPLPSPEKLQNALRQAGIRAREARVFLSQSMFRQLRAAVPPVAAEELCAIAQLHVETELGEVADQLVLDHELIQVEGQDPATLRIYGLPCSLRDSLQELFQSVHMECTVITPQACGWSAAIPRDFTGSTVLIVPRNERLEIAAFQGRQLVSHQLRKLRLDPLAKDGQQLMGELRRSGMAFAAHFAQGEVFAFKLIGDPQIWSSLTAQVKASSGTEIQVVSHDEMVQWKTPFSAVERDAWQSLGMTASMVAHDQIPSINFLDPRRPADRGRQRRKQAMAISAALLILLAASSVWVTQRQSALRARLALLKHQETELASRLEPFAGVNQLERFLTQRGDEQVDWIATLQTLRSYLSDNRRVYLEYLVGNAEEAGGVHLRGQLLAQGPPALLDLNEKILAGGQLEMQPRGAEPTRSNPLYGVRMDLDAMVPLLTPESPAVESEEDDPGKEAEVETSPQELPDAISETEA